MSHDMFEPNVRRSASRRPALMLADVGDAEFYARLVAGTRHVSRYHRGDSYDPGRGRPLLRRCRSACTRVSSTLRVVSASPQSAPINQYGIVEFIQPSLI
jgi:hypothetical protein